MAETTGNPGGGESALSGGSVGDYGYSGGGGYGPGYGDPGGGEGYGYRPPGSAGPDEAGGDVDPGPGPDRAAGPAGEGQAPAGQVPDAAVPPALPVVAATPALKGYPGGPGLEPADEADGAAVAVPGSAGAGPEARDLTSPSVWQRSQRAWRGAGVEWQRPAADRELAGTEWERTAPVGPPPRSDPSRRPDRSRLPGMSRRPRMPHRSGKLSLTAGPRRLSGRTGRPPGRAWHRRGGAWLAVIAVLVIVALVVAGFLASGGKGPSVGASSGTATVRQYPPARLAGADFGTMPAQQARGIFQSVSGVAASGGTVVAVGSLTGQWVPRAQFLVSRDGGRSWRLAPVRGPGGAVPSPADLPLLVAGGAAPPGSRDGWLAVGNGAAWTSPDGTTWTLAPGKGIAPQAADRMLALARTSRGYLVVGEHVPRVGPARSSPVAWTSATGLNWRRRVGAALHLAVSGGRVLSLIRVAARGGHVIVEGEVASSRRAGHRAPSRSDRVWRSTDGGARWAPAHLPDGRISGIAATGSGFVAVRSGGTRKTGSAAVAYVSSGGSYWRRAATITAGRKDHLTVTAVGGTDQGAVVSGQVAGGARIAWVSTDGTTWRRVANLGSSAQSLAGVTVTAGRTVVAAGAAVRAADGQQPYLVVAAARARTVSFRAIPGATGPALGISDIAAAGRTRVAVGTANGYPAIWSTGGPGRWRRIGSPALIRPGLGTLAGVAHGRRGWLAVGGFAAGTSSRPVVVTSAGGTRWQAADGEAAFAGPGITVSQAAAGRSGYVIAGRRVIPARTVTMTTITRRHKHVTRRVIPSRTVAAAWWSAGLAGWTRGSDAVAGALDGAGARQMNAVSAAGTGFVGVGSVSGGPAAWTSPDGRRWDLVTLPAPAGSTAAVLQKVAARGRVIVAAGTDTTPAGPAPFAEYSVDGGRTWRQEPLRAPGGFAAVTAVTAAGPGFEAAGTAGPPGRQRVVLWSSRDGAAWTTREPAGTGLDSRGSQAITALTASGSLLTGVGYLATPASEQPTLWQAAAASG